MEDDPLTVEKRRAAPREIIRPSFYFNYAGDNFGDIGHMSR